MSEQSKVKINLKSGEIEINGSEEFIGEQLEKIKDILFEFYDTNEINEGSENINPEENFPSEISGDNSEDELPESFGEFYNKFPRTLNQTDQALVAGFFIQKKSDSNEFKTSEVNKTLKEQGIKLTNAADSLKSLSKTKKIFVNSKSGKLSLYRISQVGEDHIISILSQSE